MIGDLTWKTLFTKLIGGVFLGMIGIVIGYFIGGLFVDMDIVSFLPWQPFLTWLGGICGFLIGTQIE